jgi:hypothetical protein
LPIKVTDLGCNYFICFSTFVMTTPATAALPFEVPYVSLQELRESVAELGFRPSYDLLWDQLTAELMSAVTKVQNDGCDGNPELTVSSQQQLSLVLPMWRLVEHTRDENRVLRRAIYRVLLHVSDVQETQHLSKRKKYESLRQKALANAANAAAAAAAASVGPQQQQG